MAQLGLACLTGGQEVESSNLSAPTATRAVSQTTYGSLCIQTRKLVTCAPRLGDLFLKGLNWEIGRFARQNMHRYGQCKGHGAYRRDAVIASTNQTLVMNVRPAVHCRPAVSWVNNLLNCHVRPSS